MLLLGWHSRCWARCLTTRCDRCRPVYDVVVPGRLPIYDCTTFTLPFAVVQLLYVVELNLRLPLRLGVVDYPGRVDCHLHSERYTPCSVTFGALLPGLLPITYVAV